MLVVRLILHILKDKEGFRMKNLQKFQDVENTNLIKLFQGMNMNYLLERPPTSQLDENEIAKLAEDILNNKNIDVLKVSSYAAEAIKVVMATKKMERGKLIEEPSDLKELWTEEEVPSLFLNLHEDSFEIMPDTYAFFQKEKEFRTLTRAQGATGEHITYALMRSLGLDENIEIRVLREAGSSLSLLIDLPDGFTNSKVVLKNNENNLPFQTHSKIKKRIHFKNLKKGDYSIHFSGDLSYDMRIQISESLN